MPMYFAPTEGQMTVVDKFVFNPATCDDVCVAKGIPRVQLSPDQLALAEKYASKDNRMSSNKRGKWGEGLIGPEYAGFIGNCGEIAACMLTGQGWDNRYLPHGDRFDLQTVDGERVNVKAMGSYYGDLLIRCTKEHTLQEYAEDSPYWHDHYLACHVDVNVWHVDFLGYATKDDVLSARKERGRAGGDHTNRVVPCGGLRDVWEMLEACNFRGRKETPCG